MGGELYGTVASNEVLTPSMRRLTFDGDGLADFSPTDCTDQYVNALFLPDDAPLSVPFDLDEARDAPAEQRPRGRRFTVRAWDDDTGTLTIDFVAHGDVGYAGRWAQRAEPGDRLQVVGPSGGYKPDPDADWHLFVGDESALPAIAAGLEAVPADAPTVAVVVVDGPDHELALDCPGALEAHWVHRAAVDAPADALADAVAALDWRPGRPDVFVHGEAGEVRAVRRHLLGERGVDGAAASISPYWRRQHTDEEWRSVKRDWLAEQAQDL